MTTPSVIVVGGGPVGVMGSLLLAQRGFDVTVFEREPQIYNLPRAIIMDAEIQRVFEGAGLLDGLRAITTPVRGAEFVDTHGVRIIGSASRPPEENALGLPDGVMYYQPELETFLRSAAIAAGVSLRVGVTVESVRDLGAGVSVSVHSGDGGTESAGADWLIAADGAASPIRKSLGVRFVDQGFDQGWLVLDVQLTNPDVPLPPFVQQICDPKRPTTFVPGHDRYRRWEFQMQPGETADEMTRSDRVWSLLDPWLTPSDAVLIRSVVYRFHATVAERMRVGRIFIAGDAAHQMPPFLGQGLCSGVRDVANLAWKLELVATGTGGETLLDTYESERLPHAAGVVAHAVDTGKLIDQLAGRSDDSIGLDAAYGGQRPFPTLHDGVLIGDHPFVGRQLPAPTVGGHRLDDLLGSGFAVVVVDPEVAAGVSERWSTIGGIVVEVPEGILGDLLVRSGAIIARPDRYIAAICSDRESLHDATDSLFASMAVDPGV